NAYEKLAPVLEKIAADSDTGRCFAYIGKGGAGHFVKMVHNGIEYGDMQLISEAYDILRRGLGVAPDAMADIFSRWNEGPLKSYLIEITARVLKFKEAPQAPHLVDLILDKAGQKGTGAWTVKAAMDEGVAIPTITAAVDARILSSLKAQRLEAAQKYSGLSFAEPAAPDTEFLSKLMRALYASKICSYAQGFALMQTVSQTRGYGLNLAEVARIWKGGCIIRAVFLDRIRRAFSDRADLVNLVVDDGFREDLTGSAGAWREVLAFATARGIPVPAMSASFAYFTSYVTGALPANLIQAQRDYFGAHTYERTDKPGIFHTHWT
ncbi:MAG: NADP-dependent phosphogluconate dehydrogenase, partial [Candidatus Omnitrophota bacterium]